MIFNEQKEKLIEQSKTLFCFYLCLKKDYEQEKIKKRTYQFTFDIIFWIYISNVFL